MTSSARFTTCTVLLVLLSCSDGDGDQHQVSKGLKIFVTERVHGADFANDPFEVGNNAIEKADAFCNGDPNKPTGATYKALIVDGVVRDAKTRTNWVLEPSTTYYRSHGDVMIGTTTSSAIFGAAYVPLTNGIEAPPESYEDWSMRGSAWTGIANAADFSAHPDCCAGWSDMSNFHSTAAGTPYATDGYAFGDIGGFGCAGFQFRLYCVEQP